MHKPALNAFHAQANSLEVPGQQPAGNVEFFIWTMQVNFCSRMT